MFIVVRNCKNFIITTEPSGQIFKHSPFVFKLYPFTQLKQPSKDKLVHVLQGYSQGKHDTPDITYLNGWQKETETHVV